MKLLIPRGRCWDALGPHHVKMTLRAMALSLYVDHITNSRSLETCGSIMHAVMAAVVTMHPSMSNIGRSWSEHFWMPPTMVAVSAPPTPCRLVPSHAGRPHTAVILHRLLYYGYILPDNVTFNPLQVVIPHCWPRRARQLELSQLWCCQSQPHQRSRCPPWPRPQTCLSPCIQSVCIYWL